MNFQKVVQSTYYLAAKRKKSYDHWSMLKMIFFADRYHLRKYARTVTGDNYYAMENGPVATTVYDIIKGALEKDQMKYVQTYLKYLNDKQNITSAKNGLPVRTLSKTDIEALDFAYNTFKALTPKELSEFSHMYPEWNRFEDVFTVNKNARENMYLADFFGNPQKTKTEISKISDSKITADPFDVISSQIVASSKEMFAGKY